MTPRARLAAVCVVSAVSCFAVAGLATYATICYFVVPRVTANDEVFWKRQFEYREAMFDVRDIRVAVTRFAAGRPLCCGEGTANLKAWSQLQDVLDGPLRDVVAATDGATSILPSANPWGGAYEFSVDPASPRRFEVRIALDNDGTPVVTRQFRERLHYGAIDEPIYADDGGREEIRVVFPL